MSSKIIILIYLIALYISCIYYDCKNIQLEKELTVKKNEIVSIQDELSTAQNNLKIVVDDATELDEALQNTTTKLKEYATTVNDLKNQKYQLIYLGDFKLTHYCVETHEHICGTGTGLTATGTYVTARRTIAVDPTVIPYGAEVYIEGYGWRVAEDTGGAINGNHIDIAVDNHSQAMSMGTTNGGVWILVKTS